MPRLQNAVGFDGAIIIVRIDLMESYPLDSTGRITQACHSVDPHPIQDIKIQVAHRLRNAKTCIAGIKRALGNASRMPVDACFARA